MRFMLSLRISILISFIVLLTACIAGSPSPTPHFYLLTPIQSEKVMSLSETGDFAITIGVTSIQVPEYLARPQIVTRIGTSELVQAEFERWAEPLSGQLDLVITENLANLLADHHVRVLSMHKNKKVDYKLEIRIIQMDGKPGELLTLIARWVLFKRHGGEVVRMKRTRITEPLSEAGYNALVAAHSLAVNQLSRKIADEV